MTVIKSNTKNKKSFWEGGFFYFLLPKRKVKEMKDKEACKKR